ncbi:DUF1330 domain-containing protein [Paenalcaligenes niemegkensis]|uniref:DUF1330 domain-containing protein n=1 Tax=Paenalcaligenes niemegkensis TaxID=2895469 RepID=UPI001EE8BBA4|nr:DUF1330 domain-containing protein [Paenalcaligenes niemegkensis]MCQ9618338.1 DUF1330 domain-containing protein [Paenalcaligenes niemegkensis]
MTAYAVAVIRETRFNDEVAEYLRRIDETLEPYSGKYIVHGGPYEPLEGAWSGDLVVIEFPSMVEAKGWYSSDAYAAIRALRTSNTEGDVLLVQGVKPGHKGGTSLVDHSEPSRRLARLYKGEPVSFIEST